MTTREALHFLSKQRGRGHTLHHHHRYSAMLSAFSSSSSSQGIQQGLSPFRFFTAFAPTQTLSQSGSNSDSNSNSNNNSSNYNNEKQRKKKKENFAKRFLDPASRGELNKHHSTGIPKLAIRKPKGHELKDDHPGKIKDVVHDAVGLEENDAGGGDSNINLNNTLASVLDTFDTTASNGSDNNSNNYDMKRIHQKKKPHPRKVNISHLFDGPKPQELNPMLSNCNEQFLGLTESDSIKAKLFQQQRILKQRGGQQQQSNTSTTNEQAGREEKESAKGGIDHVVSSSWNKKPRYGGGGGGRNDRPKLDLWGDPIPPAELDDPMLTPYQSFTYHTPHTESRREAKPIKHPSNRINPSPDFIQKYNAFAFVSNIPRPVIKHDNKEEELGNFYNPLHRHHVCDVVANALSIPVTDVFAASMTCAFVGFDSSKIANDVFNKSESGRILYQKIEYGVYSDSYHHHGNDKELDEFVSSAPSKECILQIKNLPGGLKTNTIQRLFYNAIPNMQTEDVYFTSPTSILIKQSSPESIQSILNSTTPSNNNTNNEFIKVIESILSRQILRIQPAKLELVHDKYVGPAKQFQLKKTTNKLIVDGDVPSEKFFLSHGGVLHLSNVPTHMTKKDISKHFDEYCTRDRDVNGSIEFVKCLDGHPTGRVYVGFDLESEANRAWDNIMSSSSNSHTKKIIFNKEESVVSAAAAAGPPPTPIFINQVQERPLRRGKKLGERTERTEDELHACLHSKWKEYVDPNDIEHLEQRGVPRGVLEDAFMAARFNNPTFGVEDLARVGERMHDNKEPGEAFRDFVKLYVETMKEVAVTKEDPGLYYKAMFLPDEEIDVSLFDSEEARVEKWAKEREKLV